MAQGLDALRGVRAPDRERFRDQAIAETCAGADVFCIQELLSEDAVLFFDGLASRGFRSTLRDHNRPDFWPVTLRGSGLGVASAAEPIASSALTFPRPSAGFDRFARKGAMSVRHRLAPGLEVDIVNTHVQAGDDRGASLARARQLDALRAWVEGLSSDARPVVVCGDLNVDGSGQSQGGAEYDAMMRSFAGFIDLGASRNAVTYWRGSTTRGSRSRARGMRLDYVLYRPAEGVRLACESIDLIFQAAPEISGPSRYASDHAGVSVAFRYAAP